MSPLSDSCLVRARGRPGQGPGRSPAGVAGAGGVLEGVDRAPDTRGLRGRAQGWSFGYAVVRVRPMVGGYPVRAVPLAAFIPSRCPRPGRGDGADSRQCNARAGPIRMAPCRLGGSARGCGLAPGGGHKPWRHRARPLASGRSRGRRQGADLVVAQAVPSSHQDPLICPEHLLWSGVVPDQSVRHVSNSDSSGFRKPANFPTPSHRGLPK